MANNFAAFFETLVAGADEYNKAKVGRTALLDAVYKDVKPEAARIGKTVDVYFPDVGPLQAINNGILTGTSVNPNYIPLVFQTRAGAALQFQDFEQWQTAVDLAQKFFDPLYKRAREYLNGQIAALITPANFNTNAPIIGATQGEVQVTDQLNAWGVLADQKVPLEDRDKLRLMVHNQVYRKMLGDSAWVQESLVSRGDRLRGSPAGRRGTCVQLPGRLGSADADVVGLDPLRPDHGDLQLRGRDWAQYRLHHAAHGGHVLPDVRLRRSDDKTQYLVSSIQTDTSLTLGPSISAATLASGTVTTTARLITSLLASASAMQRHHGHHHVFQCGSLTPSMVGQWIIDCGRHQRHGSATLPDRHDRECHGGTSSLAHAADTGWPTTASRPPRRPCSPTPTWPCTSMLSLWPCVRSPRRTRPATSSTSRTSTSWASPCGSWSPTSTSTRPSSSRSTSVTPSASSVPTSASSSRAEQSAVSGKQ